MELDSWLSDARDQFSHVLDSKIKVIGVIGKDYPDHGKGDNVNCYLRDNVFPVASSASESCKILAHYSEDDQLLFLVMNNVDDVANIRKNLKNSEKNYFEALAASELQEQRMLHFLFIACHFIVIFEQTSRIDLEFMRNLKKANISRMQLRRKVNKKLVSSGLKEIPFNNRILSAAESEGRVVIPRLLIAFQRNNIRSDLNAVKKSQREIYEKLEKNLDSQFNDILKTCELIDCGPSSLCQLNETIPCVHLMNPKTVKRDIVQEMFEAIMADFPSHGKKGNGQPTSQPPNLPSNNSFIMFLEDNFRSEKNEISLENVIQLLECLHVILDGDLEDVENNWELTSRSGLVKKLQKEHLERAIRMYTNENLDRRGMEPEPVKVRSKEEHMMRFAEATNYIESVVGTNTSQALAELHARCDELWQSDMRACEAVSLMGRPCVKKIHPTYGDKTVSELKWSAHDAQSTLISTCICGKRQLLRQEPFSVKEANCDFYEHPEFKCCRRLWRFQFQLYQEVNDDDILWADRDSNSLNAKVPDEEQEDELIVTVDSENSLLKTESVLEDEASDSEDARVGSQSSTCSDDSLYIRPSSSCRRDDAEKSIHEMQVEYTKRLQKLESSGKSPEFITSVPNSLTAGRLPLFPSWYLVSLGDSSLYGHGSGLKGQPNFKIGGDYLTPAVVHLPVDLDTWNRDLHKLRAEDYSARKYLKDDAPRVKLFVGFEYECSRGHRFFVDHLGEPLIYPKGANVVRESAARSQLGDVLQADLPLRRPCTCRKQPLKSAQLQKIHVVTPKAPVHITVEPKITVPGHEGVYGTGQSALELHHSKYYILHLPAVYSGPSGTWSPEEYSPEKQGTFWGGAIKVAYKPVFSLRF